MIALVKSGYIKEDLSEIDSFVEHYLDNYEMVKGYFRSHRNMNRHDYHTIEVERTKQGLKEIEGTEKQIPDCSGELKITCGISGYQDYTGNRDLDNEFHEGFTIGNGKQLYWMMLWHKTGHVTVYNKTATSGRWISGDSRITIHFKPPSRQVMGQ